MRELVERLRERANDSRDRSKPFNLLLDAAEEIERLTRENKVLSELRRDFLTLQKRIIGGTGLSAIETIDRALKVFDALHLYEIFDEDRAATIRQHAEDTP
ncbi:hypothetical protein GOB48_22345 [Sinorhizobium meliloti]|nr:hypothetical protein [Sinorhizobium meliloti]